MGIYDLTIYDMICRNAVLFKDKPAWFEAETEQTLTFSQIKNLVDSYARGLQQIGVQKQDRIGIVGKNCLEYFVLYGAIAAMGGIAVPVNWRLSAEEAAHNLNDVQARLVFAQCDDPQWFDQLHAKLDAGTHCFNLQPGNGALPDFAAASTGQPIVPADVSTDDGFVIIHTAAVAGRPRGALLSHANVLWANMHLMYCFNLTEQDVHLNLLPLFHIAGLGMALHSFHGGALNLNMRKFDAVRAVELIANKKVSLLFEFAPILKSILDQQEQTGADIGSLRAVMGLDAAETIERYQQVTGGTFYIMYGQTETSMLASMSPYNDCPGSAGRPLPMAEVCLVDDRDQPVAPGEVGEIVMRGPMVFKGYWNLDQENAQTFRNGWHHTGDLGRMTPDGFLWYAGRKPEKELIKPGGENVYPAEVENVILEHPGVAAVVVFGVPDPKWKEGIKAVCQLKPGEKLTANELIEFVGARIARYKKPQYVEFAAQLPLKADGALDRAAIKAQHGGI
jgi:acyl-CoA synthetase (AMP-forming)/AMP-acid ligase II